MNRYRVDFYQNNKIVSFVFVSAWSRKEAWIESWKTKEYKSLNSDLVMWDATKIDFK